MKSIIKSLLCLGRIVVLGSVSVSNAQQYSFDKVFNESMIERFDHVADRIEDLSEDRQQRVYDRIDRFIERFEDRPIVVSMLNYIKTASMRNDSSVAGIAMNDENFSTLVSLIQAADLGETLMDDDAMYSVFAPTNDAFEDALEALDMTADELMDNEMMLQNILLTHILDMRVFSDQIASMQNMSTIQSLEGTRLTIDTMGTIMVDDAELLQADILANNGVIHVIDSVLLPDMYRDASERSQSIADIAMNTTSLSVLVDLVGEAGLVETLIDEDQNLTVFAPSNQAFMTYLDDNSLSLTDIKSDDDTLRDILLYHVVEGSYNAQAVMQLGNTTQIETLNGETINIMTQGGVMINDAELVQTDIWATNGIVHIIDTVLLP